jgi:hypothetical protein
MYPGYLVRWSEFRRRKISGYEIFTKIRRQEGCEGREIRDEETSRCHRFKEGDQDGWDCEVCEVYEVYEEGGQATR